MVKFDFSRESSFRVQGDHSEALNNLIPALSARRLLRKGRQGCLAMVKDVEAQVPNLDRVLVVRDFPNCFLRN